MKCLKPFKVAIIFLAICTSGANAAPIAINTMFVESASATLNLFGALPPPPVTATGAFNPAVEIAMGTYQDLLNPILSVSQNGLTLSIYSTGSAGIPPPPSGYVDGNTITVDFSSLRARVTYLTNSFDTALWPLTTTLDYGIYDPLTGDYIVGWHENFNFIVDNNTLNVSLSGYLNAVPVPAAFWLFGSGLIALFGFANSKKH